MSKRINNLNKSLAENITPDAIGAATNSDLNAVKNNIGTISNLKTNNKTIVEAINELVQNIDIPKQKLVDLMLDNGYEIEENSSMIDLIDLLKSSNIAIKDLKQVACGYLFSFVLKYDGTLLSTGQNMYGQLGLGHTNNTFKFTEVITDVAQVECGNNYAMILKKDGTVWSCGLGSYGNLGLGDLSSVANEVDVFTQTDMTDVKKIFCHYYSSFALKNDGTLWSCGYNEKGQLGLNNTTSRNVFTLVDNISDIKDIACGSDHTLLLKNDGSLWACGYNDYGELCINVNISEEFRDTGVTGVEKIFCGDSVSYILKSDGTLWGCGLNSSGQLGLGNNTNQSTLTQINISGVKQIDCYSNHAVLVKNDGTLWVAGNNTRYEIGLNDTDNDVTIFTQIPSILNAKDARCGYQHTIVITEDDKLMGAGRNDKGSLGFEVASDVKVFTQIQLNNNQMENNSVNFSEFLGEKSCYIVSDVGDASYNFVINSSGYYESTNNGIANSAALCRLFIYNPEGKTISLSCINYAESTYDFGIISKINTSLDVTHAIDASSSCLKSFSGSSSASVQTVDLSSETGWYYIKYRKDNSQNSNNDSLQFKVNIT